MSEEIKIITLGDIFDNIETEEKAFKFKDYIKDLQQKVEQQENEINRLNNIINQLEKWAKSIQLTVYRSDDMPVYKYQDVLDKLKELKGE